MQVRASIADKNQNHLQALQKLCSKLWLLLLHYIHTIESTEGEKSDGFNQRVLRNSIGGEEIRAFLREDQEGVVTVSGDDLKQSVGVLEICEKTHTFIHQCGD